MIATSYWLASSIIRLRTPFGIVAPQGVEKAGVTTTAFILELFRAASNISISNPVSGRDGTSITFK
jgi:hypothetical protein